MTATNDPEPCDLLVAGGRVLDLAASAGVDDHAAIAIRAGFIVAVDDEAEIRSAWRPLRRIDAAGQVVAPGFVDAHVHLSACPDLDAAVRNHRRRRCRKLRNRRARTSSVDVGIRAAIGPSLTDQRHDPAGRLVRQADVGELLAGIAALAKDRDIPTHVHSHISEGSTKAHLEFFHRTQTARLQNAGLLSERCIVMHAGWLNDDDIAAFGSARVRANHNPVGNAMLGFGTVRAGSVLRL